MLFFTTLFLFAIASQEYIQYYDANPYIKSQYTFDIGRSNEGTIKNVLVHLSKYKEYIQDVSLTGFANIESESGTKHEISVSAYYPENLSGFYVMRGTDSLDKNSNQILIENNSGATNLLETGLFSSDSGTSTSEKLSRISISGAGDSDTTKQDFDTVGFVTSNNCSCPGSIICNYDKYYSITEYTNSIVIQCSKELSRREEKDLISDISSVVDVKGIDNPYMNDQLALRNMRSALFLFFGVIFFCMLGSIQLLVYYVDLRNPEFRIYRLLGIPRTFLSGYILATIFAILLPGMLAGTCLYGLAGFLLPSFDLFRAMSIGGFCCLFGGFLLLSMLMITAARAVQSALSRKDALTEVRT